MHKKFDSTAIEKKWQAKWDEQKLYDAGERDQGKEKEYVLVELPYPSGNLHIGHWYAFAVPDIYVRYRRMTGVQAIYPMGFDAFGLPAENAAIKRDINPREWTESNIDYMKTQLKSMGNAFSWDKTASTIDPDYYRWTQWMFTQFFEHDIAYRGEGKVNWCPGCNTVIANEQVLPDGTCERCGNEVEKKTMPQWMLRITDYADALVDDLDELDWPEHIKDAQRNWIGRSQGAKIDFVINTDRKHYVILHGFEGSPDEVFIPWLKAELEQQGHTVDTPVLPKTSTPSEDEQVSYVLENCKIDENTILIGHSLGSVVALKVAEKLDHKLHKLILVAGFLTPDFKDHERNFSNTFEWSFDFSKIIENGNSITILSALNDTAVDTKHGRQLAAKLDARLVEFEAEDDHACGITEPVILNAAIDTVTVFTTRPDTLYGTTYMVLAPEHPLLQTDQVRDQVSNLKAVDAYIAQTKRKADQDRLDNTKEKTGVKLEGVTATNPANGEEIPVFIADYVLGGYGTGAIMAVPAHDERDYVFAKKFGIEIRNVVAPDNPRVTIDDEPTVKIEDVAEYESILKGEAVYTLTGTLRNSGEFNGINSELAESDIVAKVSGRWENTYRLRDWSIGRQRYWGVPIPIVYDPERKAHPVPEEHLPWTLPDDVDFHPTGEAPLAKSKELKERTARIFGDGWTPEVETMDTFVDSSWYFLRYIDNQCDTAPASLKAQQEWMPVDLYFGGAEHTTMHLLYSRFWQKALLKLGLAAHNEPYKRRLNRGLILGPDGNKMSKSKGNVVDPDEQVSRVGADTVKMYLAFMGPYGEVVNYPWDMGGIAGIRRFLEKVYGLSEHITDTEPEAITKQLHRTIEKARKNMETFKFNTTISAAMEFVNTAEKTGLSQASYESFLRMLAPFAPHLTEELWHQAGKESSIHLESYPQADPTMLVVDEVTIGVQVNGKHRGSITVAPEADEATAIAAAQAEDAVTRWLTSDIKKIIYVPGRILNIIVT